MKLSKVVTTYFQVVEELETRIRFRPGLDLLAGTLVRNGAHKILIPYVDSTIGTPFEDVIAQLPTSLKNRIRVVDRKHHTRRRVLEYLRPIQEEMARPVVPLTLLGLFEFLYKLALACEHHAEADIEMMHNLRWAISSPQREGRVKDAESKARLDQLLGLLNLYDKPVRIPSFRLTADFAEPSIPERIGDFLDEAEIQKYSEDRYLLGVPGKAKSAYLRLKKWGKRKVSRLGYSFIAKLSYELVKLVSQKIPDIPLSAIPDLAPLSKMAYVPPIIDLTGFRIEASGKVQGNSIQFVRPDGVSSVYTVSDQHKMNYAYGMVSNAPIMPWSWAKRD